MGTTVRSVATALLVGSVLLLPACVKRASEAEVEQMCQRLVQLHTELATAEAQNAQMETCRAEARREKPFQEVAACRTQAASLDAYWNRCR